MKFAPCSKESLSAPTGKKVAIVGAGPAGLTAAGHLVCMGHEVVVYDMMPEPGGMIVFAIPDFRFNKEPIYRGIKELYNLGVKFVLNTKVGKDVALEELMRSYDAVVIATGTWKSSKLGIEGEDLNGVYYALELLVDVGLSKRGYKPLHEIPSFEGKRVAVIGGGDTAVDAARTLLRMNAGEVLIVYRRTKEASKAGPREIEKAENEGAKFIPLTQPIRFIGEQGQVVGIEAIKMRLGAPDSSGRPRPEPVPGSEHVIPVDSVVIACGERATPPPSCEKLGLKLDKWGCIITDEYGRTNIEGVFAAGDVVTGPSRIGPAMVWGRKAAKAVDEYLRTGVWPSLKEDAP